MLHCMKPEKKRKKIPSRMFRAEMEKIEQQKNVIHCPCGSGTAFKVCCEPYLNHEKYAPTPEALMRSRYTAYFKGNLDYIEATMRGPALIGFDKRRVPKYPQEWIGLEVIRAHGDLDPDIGYVEFIAHYLQNNKKNQMHEISKFHREEGRWYYVDGEH